YFLAARADPFQAGSAGADVSRLEHLRISKGQHCFPPGDLFTEIQNRSEAVTVGQLQNGEVQDFNGRDSVSQFHSIHPGLCLTLARCQHSVSSRSCRRAHSITTRILGGGSEPAITSYSPNAITAESSPIQVVEVWRGMILVKELYPHPINNRDRRHR